MSPALEGGFLTTGPPGKSQGSLWVHWVILKRGTEASKHTSAQWHLGDTGPSYCMFFLLVLSLWLAKL